MRADLAHLKTGSERGEDVNARKTFDGLIWHGILFCKQLA